MPGRVELRVNAAEEECPALCMHASGDVTPFNWNNGGSDRIVLVDLALGSRNGEAMEKIRSFLVRGLAEIGRAHV